MICATVLAGAGVANALTVEDYCDLNLSRAASVKEMRPLADGVSYAAISDDGRSIDVYSYKTGKKVSTLFSVDNIKGDVKISDFDGYELSQNEKKILLWNDVEKIYRRSFRATYYVYDVTRGTMSKVSEQGPQRGAVMSHDGRCVAYTRGNNIYISNLDYQTDRAITEDGKENQIIYGVPDWGYEEEFGVDNTMHWSADDNTLVYMRFDESKVPTYSFDAYRSYCDSDPLGDPYPESYSYKYPLAGYPNSIVGVYSYDMNNRVSKQIQLDLKENDYVPDLQFDGTGTQLMVMVVNRDQNALTLYKCNPASTVARAIFSEKSEAWLAPEAYQMVRYYDNSFVIGSDRSGYRHLYEYDYNGNLKRQLSKGDFNITAYYGMDSRSKTHFVQTTRLGAVNRNVESIDNNGRMAMLNGVEGWETAGFSRNFDFYLRCYSNVSTPSQYTICNNKGKKIAEIEMNASYAAKFADAPKMELLTVKNAEGKEMSAYMIKPADFDASKKYPLLMYQYNGPDSQEVMNKWRMEGLFYIASQGYVVAAVDGRGTANRERSWAQCVYRNLGKYETLDQIAGANQFRELPYIDNNRTACFGWSYGGYMTLMELTQPNNPFKAGVAMAAVTDWRWYDSIYTERFMLTPRQNESGYNAASAINRTQNLDCKLLIMSGTSDDNVHYYNTLKYTSKLNFEGKLFDMMSYTGFEHSLRMCNARVQLYRKVVEFLDSNVK